MRDIQFNDPEIAVLACAPIEIIKELLMIFISLRESTVPRAAAIGLRHALENPRIAAIFDQNDKDCAGVAFTFLQDRGKSARGLDLSDQPRDFEMRGEPLVHASLPWAWRRHSLPARKARSASA